MTSTPASCSELGPRAVSGPGLPLPQEPATRLEHVAVAGWKVGGTRVEGWVPVPVLCGISLRGA